MAIPQAPVGAIGGYREASEWKQVLTCPRCQIRTLPVGYPGALSRADNRTEICSACGTEEAMSDFAGGNAGAKAKPERDWPIHPVPVY